MPMKADWDATDYDYTIVYGGKYIMQRQSSSANEQLSHLKAPSMSS